MIVEIKRSIPERVFISINKYTICHTLFVYFFIVKKQKLWYNYIIKKYL